MKLRKPSTTLTTQSEKDGKESSQISVKSLHQAAEDLSTLLKAYNEGQSETALNEIIGATGASLAAAVDRRIHFLDLIDANIEAAEKAKRAWTERYRILERLRNDSHERIKDIITANAYVDFAGTMGGISLQDNPAALDTDLALRNKSVSNLVTEAEIFEHKIPQKYLTYTEVVSLNTEAVRQDLKDGVELSWARLTKGKRIRWGANA